MTEKMGLINQEVRLVKKDDELIHRIVEARGIALIEWMDPTPLQIIINMLRYNIWTMTQFSELTGLAISTIANKCRPVYKDGELITDLDFCHPFADMKGTGPKFIIRNEKSERYLP